MSERLGKYSNQQKISQLLEPLIFLLLKTISDRHLKVMETELQIDSDQDSETQIIQAEMKASRLLEIERHRNLALQAEAEVLRQKVKELENSNSVSRLVIKLETLLKVTITLKDC